MIYIDFFNANKETQLAAFCDYFRLEKNRVLEFFKVNDFIAANQFVNEFKLDCNEYDSSEVQIVCRHMTTTADIGTFIEKGLLNLKAILEPNTPLSKFLLERNIIIDTDKELLILNEKEYPIVNYCEWLNCKKMCELYSLCEPKGMMDNLRKKLYQRDATIEFFINATVESIKEYTSIYRCPEILGTLDKIIRTVPKEKLNINLEFEWGRINTKCYILEFTAKLSDMITFEAWDWDEGVEELVFGKYCNCFELSEYDFEDYTDKRIPKNVLDNIKFLEWFIDAYCCDGEITGSLLPDMNVPPKAIKFIEIRGN